MKLLQFSCLQTHSQVRHFVSTRTGGVSTGQYDSLNLGLRSGDLPEKVYQNRARLATSLGVSAAQLLFPEQVHESRVQYVADLNTDLRTTDALITDRPELYLCVLSADCVPLLFFDAEKKVIGAAHAGWRGTVQQIGLKTLRAMQARFGTRPESVRVGVGPTVSPERYEVGADVISAVQDKLPEFADRVLRPHTNPEKAFLDLRAANRLPLLQAGVPASQLDVMPYCTLSDERFFSARRQGVKSGRFAAGIRLMH